MKPSKSHPWRRKHFAPPPSKAAEVWASGTMVDASALQRATVEAEANRQEWRRKNGFRAIQNSLFGKQS
jgi:hypothetical protein